MPFKQMEQISLFLRGIGTFGVQEFEVFDTNDLYQGKDMRKVVQCIHSIGTAIKKVRVDRAAARRQNSLAEQTRLLRAAIAGGS